MNGLIIDGRSSDRKQTVTNDSYPAVKATADSGPLRAET